jgi:DNA-binding NarL/FixJ family response regulator
MQAMNSQHFKTRTYKILVVDDHPVVRHGMAQLIAAESDLEVCGEASDAGDALDLIKSTSPDLMMVDISLQGVNGIELIKQVKAIDSSIRMLVASMHDESLFAERALRAGAMGYISKEADGQEIVTAIRQILKGKIYLSPRMADHMLHRVVDGNGELAESSIETLSDRELQVFELIGKGLSTREVAKRLHLSPKTVETYREHIKAKLNLKNSNELVRHAVKWELDR